MLFYQSSSQHLSCKLQIFPCITFSTAANTAMHNIFGVAMALGNKTVQDIMYISDKLSSMI